MWLINILSGIFLLALGLMIKIFKMTYLIAGYNTASKKEKQKYDKEKLVKYIGNLLIIGSIILLFGGILSLLFNYYEGEIFFFSWIIFIIFTVIGVIYINVSGCVKKQKELK